MSKVLILLGIVFSAVLGVIAVISASSRSSPLQMSSIASSVIKDYIVVHIGESNSLLSEVLELLRMSKVSVAEFSDLERLRGL